jgi:hypothetical protein
MEAEYYNELIRAYIIAAEAYEQINYHFHESFPIQVVLQLNHFCDRIQLLKPMLYMYILFQLKEQLYFHGVCIKQLLHQHHFLTMVKLEMKLFLTLI